MELYNLKFKTRIVYINSIQRISLFNNKLTLQNQFKVMLEYQFLNLKILYFNILYLEKKTFLLVLCLSMESLNTIKTFTLKALLYMLGQIS